MSRNSDIRKIATELEKGIALSKCKKCGCMRGALEEMRNALQDKQEEEAMGLLEKIDRWLAKIEKPQYS